MKLSKIILSTIAAAALLVTVSCANKPKEAAKEAVPSVTNAVAAENKGPLLELNGDSDSGKAGALQTVYFDFNSAQLTEQTKNTLKDNADFLKKSETIEVQVEGHADERGSVQYNLALGEKRAKTVKSYLMGLGIKVKRMSTISYGKERPLTFGHDESSWSKNRRANFVITTK